MITESLAAIDGPGHHFGFGQASVLAQTTPQQTQTAVSAQQTQQAAAPPPLTGQTGVPCATQVGQVCTVVGAVSGSWTKTGSGSFTVTATVPATAILNDGVPIIFLPTTAGVETFTAACGVPTTIGGSVTCSGTTVGDLLQGAVVTVRFVTTGGFQDVTGTVTGPGGAALTNQIALTRAQTTAGFTVGQAGVPCASAIGQTCQITGATTGTCTVTGSMTCTVTGTSTPAAGAGTAIAVFTTTIGNEFIACTATGIGGTSTTCTGTLAGNALQGSTVAVVFPAPGGVSVGTITGPGAPLFPGAGNLLLPNLPLLPPPPLEFIPPPPPPLLPPPPPAPMGAMAAPRMAGFPEVPVIPEADSLFLLVGGLVALGGLVGYRKLRRRDDA
jgi:hypothetical protein